MRHTVTYFSIKENLPHCENCGADLVFANAADLARDKRVYLIFKCNNCSAGETKVWRPEWQTLADALEVDE